jgi:Protein of unknown function (DUF732)
MLRIGPLRIELPGYTPYHNQFGGQKDALWCAFRRHLSLLLPPWMAAQIDSLGNCVDREPTDTRQTKQTKESSIMKKISLGAQAKRHPPPCSPGHSCSTHRRRAPTATIHCISCSRWPTPASTSTTRRKPSHTGHWICGEISRGLTPSEVASQVYWRNGPYTATDAAMHVVNAVEAFCPWYDHRGETNGGFLV